MDDNIIKNELDAFVELYSKTKAKSEEWMTAKMVDVKIGGSTLAAILGQNKYKSREDARRDYAKYSSGDHFTGSVPTRFGNLMEEVGRTRAAEVFECDIVGHDIYIDNVDGIGVSPDGYGIVSHALIREKCKDGAGVAVDGKSAVLFEFKCPYRRRVGGNIPKEYVPQVRLGMAVSPFVSYGIYAEFMIRRALLTDLSTPLAYIRNASTDLKRVSPIKMGFIGMYVMNESRPEFSSHLTNELEKVSSMMIGAGLPNEYKDLNMCDEAAIDELVSHILAGSVNTYYSGQRDTAAGVYAEMKEYELYMSALGDNRAVSLGIVPWKLLRENYIVLTKQDGYMEFCKPEIDAFRQKVLEDKAAIASGMVPVMEEDDVEYVNAGCEELTPVEREEQPSADSTLDVEYVDIAPNSM